MMGQRMQHNSAPTQNYRCMSLYPKNPLPKTPENPSPACSRALNPKHSSRLVPNWEFWQAVARRGDQRNKNSQKQEQSDPQNPDLLSSRRHRRLHPADSWPRKRGWDSLPARFISLKRQGVKARHWRPKSSQSWQKYCSLAREFSSRERESEATLSCTLLVLSRGG